jgi:hypothetical protein
MIPDFSRRFVKVEDAFPAIAEDCYMPKRAAAKYLGMSCRKLEGLHGIERYRIGGMIYFRRSILDEFMRAHVEIMQPKHEPTQIRRILETAKKHALADQKND